MATEKETRSNSVHILESGKGDDHSPRLSNQAQHDAPFNSHTRNDLRRNLQPRHISMIAIGGALGTGLIIGTGAVLARAGPASILLAYGLVGMLVYMVMCALGEMATYLPLPSGFTGYASRFCDPALGFALGYTYWFKYIITTPNQLVATALVIQYWCPPDRVNPGVWVAVFLVVIILINSIGTVGVFGEVEFWLSCLKVCVIVGVMICCLVIALGGAPTHDRTGFRYWHHPGAFKPYLDTGAAGNFYGFWSGLVTAVFAFLGTELVGVTVGEAQNPRRTIPRAIRLTFWRIVVFYIISVVLLGMCVPYNSPALLFANKKSSVSNAAASPFVVAIQLAKIRYLPSILNAGFLIFVASAANSDLYIASRTLYGLACEGKAPSVLRYTNSNGIPVVALACSSCFCLLAFMSTAKGSSTVFGYFVNLVAMFGLLTWISILVSHIFFVRARKAQGIANSSLAYKAPFGIWGSYIALFFCCLIALTKNFNVFVGKFDYANFITGYLGIPLYLIMIVGYKFIMKSQKVQSHTADLYTDKDIIDREEEEYLARRAQKLEEGRGQRKGSILYKLVSWLF